MRAQLRREQNVQRGLSEMVERMSLSLLFDDQRQNYVNGRTFPGRTADAELALQLADALAHTGNANAEKRISTIAVQRRGHSDTVVADCQADVR